MFKKITLTLLAVIALPVLIVAAETSYKVDSVYSRVNFSVPHLMPLRGNVRPFWNFSCGI